MRCCERRAPSWQATTLQLPPTVISKVAARKVWMLTVWRLASLSIIVYQELMQVMCRCGHSSFQVVSHRQ